MKLLIQTARLLTTVCMLCLASPVISQTAITGVEYYFDTDPGYGNATPLGFTAGSTNIADATIPVNPTNLSEGVHRLYVRAKSANGWSMTNKWLFYKPYGAGGVPPAPAPAPIISRIEYYFDTDPGFGNATQLSAATLADLPNLIIPVDPTNMTEGVHRLYVRAKSANGWSMTNKWLFYKPYGAGGVPPAPAPAPIISRIEYYFDNDPGFGNATQLSAASITDLSDLLIPVDPTNMTEGVHRLYVRAKSSNGWSMTNKWLFYKPYGAAGAPPAPAPAPIISRIEYYFDNDPGFGNATPLPASSMNELSDLLIPVDPTAMTEGVHRLYMRAKSSNGWSLTNKWLFFKPFTPESIPAAAPVADLTGVEYYIDTDPGFGNGKPVAIEALKEVSNSQLFINISSYAVGTHKLFVRAKNKNGNWSLVNQQDFNITAAQSSPSIIVNSSSRTTICTKDSFAVGYDAIGTFNTGNTFKVFISNASGSFSTETEIGSIVSSKSGVIKCLLPNQIGNGSGYLLRIKSSNTALTGAASQFSITVSTGGSSPSVSVTGPAVWCPGYKDTLTASAGSKYLWSTGDTTQSIIVGTPGIYTVNVTNSNCSILATANVAPVLNTPPVLSYSGVTNFVSEVVSPKTGLPTDIFRFEAKYTDADGNLPQANYPQLLLDFEGNGSLEDANDRLFYLQEKNPNDQNVKDGKDYYFTTSALAESPTWKTSFLATDAAGCSSAFGPINGPAVLTNTDISIFANDISFSDPKPDTGSMLTVYATIRNNSGKDAGPFTVHLVNQFQPNVVYPDIVVPGLPATNYNSRQVSWTIKTPSSPAWCPMQVFIDYGNALAEPNELDNQAIRPFTNGKFTLPGDIKITAQPNPDTTLVNSTITVSGTATYRNTAVVLSDPSCAGATVTATLVETGQTGYGYTNAKGDYSIGLGVPASPGLYHVNMQITDYTLDGDTTTAFTAQVIVVPPCVGPDLSVGITLSPGTVITSNGGSYILPGGQHTAKVVVTNNGQLSAGASVLHFELPDGTPVPGNVNIPAIATGKTFTVNIPAMTFTKVGSTYLRAFIDYNNAVDECNETNNSAIAGINVLPALPDIVATSGPYSGLTSAYKCNFKSITFGIANIGGAPTGNFNARLFVTHNGTQTMLNKTVSSILPLGLSSVSFDYLPGDTGIYSFALKLDSPNQVIELSELNNNDSTDVNMLICLPDLSVFGCGNMSVKPADPAVPGNITIYAIVHNGGNANATQPFNVDFNVAGTHYLVPVNSLNINESKQISIVVPTIYGNNQLIVTADPANTVRELGETNNAATGSLCWDFALTNGVCNNGLFINTNQYVGRPVTLATGLFNYGLYEATHAQVKFEVSGPGLTGWLNLGYVSSYAGNTCSCPIGLQLPGAFAFPAIGTYQVRITADFNGQYVECNEANNVLIVTVNVSNQPEYFVKSEYIAPSLLNPDVNQKVDLDITYTNLGQGNGNAFEVFTQVDNTPHDSVRVNGVLGGQTNTVRMSKQWSSSIRGIHVIRAIVDHDNEIPEPDELNNDATRAIVVGQSPNLNFNSFTVSNAYPATGAAVTINAIIKNNGYTGVYATYQLFYLDNNKAEVLIRQQAIAVDSAGSIQVVTPWVINDTRTTFIGRIINGNPIEYDATDNEASVEIGKLVLTVSGKDAACATVSNGQAKVTILGGMAPFSKTWNNGMTGDSILVAPGKYVVNVTDAEGTNLTSDTVTVNAGNQPVASFSGLLGNYQLTAAAATLTGVPAGGIFSGPGINGNQFIPSNAGAGGPYTITYTYTNAGGCTATATAQTYVSAITGTRYYRDADGDSYGNPANSILSATPLPGYVLTNTDCNDDPALGGATIYPGAPEICDGKDNNCNGQTDESCVNAIVVTATIVKAGACVDDGSITLKNTGGKAPFTYSLNGLAYQAGSKFDNLVAGNYTGYVKDAQGSIGSLQNIAVGKTTTLAITATTIGASSCANDGKITIGKTGGTTPYTYSMNGITYGTTYSFGPFAPGIYEGYVKDAKGCIASMTGITIIRLPAMIAKATIVGVSNCATADGKITLSRTNGTAPFTYSLDNINYVITAAFTGLATGTYTGYIKDAKSCSASITNLVVTKLPAMIAKATVVGVSNCATADGKITLSRTNGTAPFTYSLNGINYVTTATFTGLATGTYTGYIKDAKGCAASITNLVVTKLPAMIAKATVVGVSNCATADGKITLSRTNGTAPFTYSLDGINYVTTATFTGLATGTYTGYIKDAKGCSASINNLVVTKLPAMVAKATVVGVSNCATADGKITLSSTNGTAPFTYSLDGINYVTTAAFTGLATDTYTGYLKDAKGCAASITNLVVTKLPAMIAKATVVGVSNCATADGKITLSSTNGTAPFKYSLDGINYVTTAAFTGLATGTYTGYLQDAKGCAASLTDIVVSKLAAITVTATVVSAAACLNDGKITLTKTGGTSPFTYSLDAINYTTSGIFSGLMPGTYSGYVKDAKGCLGSKTGIIVGKTAPLSVTAKSTATTCIGASDGAVTATRTGGTTAYLYQLSKGAMVYRPYQTSTVFKNVVADTYTLTVKDSRGCLATTSIAVTDGTASCPVAPLITKSKQANKTPEKEPLWLTVSSYPNPSSTYFNLKIESNSEDKVAITVVDMYGHKLYGQTGAAQHTYTFGQRFAAGTYSVQVIQGKQIQTLKLVKFN